MFISILKPLVPSPLVEALAGVKPLDWSLLGFVKLGDGHGKLALISCWPPIARCFVLADKNLGKIGTNWSKCWLPGLRWLGSRGGVVGNGGVIATVLQGTGPVRVGYQLGVFGPLIGNVPRLHPSARFGAEDPRLRSVEFCQIL